MNLHEYVGRRVRVRFADGHLWCEGIVIGYHTEPTLLVSLDDGTERAVSTMLLSTTEVVERRAENLRTPDAECLSSSPAK